MASPSAWDRMFARAQDWAKERNAFYEEAARSYFLERNLPVPGNLDVFKHAIGSADGPHRLAQELNIDVPTARMLTVALGDANELYSDFRNRDDAVEHYKDLTNNLVGNLADRYLEGLYGSRNVTLQDRVQVVGMLYEQGLLAAIMYLT